MRQFKNFQQLEQEGVKLDAEDCSTKQVLHYANVEGPGESIHTLLDDETWKVRIHIKKLSLFLIATVRRYSDGTLAIDDDWQQQEY